MLAVVHREQVRPGGVDVVALRRGERGVRVAALLEPLVGPRIGVLPGRARGGQLGAHGERVVAEPVVYRERVVAVRGKRGQAGSGVDVPGQWRRRRTDYLVATRGGGLAPDHAGVGGGVVGRRTVREDRPLRVVGVIVDQILADQDRPVARVDVGGERHRGAVRTIDVGAECDQVCRAGTGGDGYRDQLGFHHRSVGATGIPDRDLPRRAGAERCAGRRVRAAGQRRADVVHGAVPEANGEQAVDAGVQAAEALTEQHRIASAHRGHSQNLERSGPALRESQEVAVCRDVRFRRCDRVCRKPERQRLARRREHRGRAERVPTSAGADVGRPFPLPGCRRDSTYAVIPDLVVLPVALNACRISLRPVLRAGRRHNAAGSGREGEHGCEQQREAPRYHARLSAHDSSPAEWLNLRCNPYKICASSARASSRWRITRVIGTSFVGKSSCN